MAGFSKETGELHLRSVLQRGGEPKGRGGASKRGVKNRAPSIGRGLLEDASEAPSVPWLPPLGGWHGIRPR